MNSIATQIKIYWWSVLLLLIGAFLVFTSIFNLIALLPKEGYTYGPFTAGVIIGWGWVLAFYIVVLFGGASIIHTGVSRILKSVKSARQAEGA